MNQIRSIAIAVVAGIAGCSPTAVVVPTVGPSPTSEVTPSASALGTATPAPAPSGTPLPSGGLVAADLDGVLTTPELAHRLPLGVSIDDNRIARPQTGFNAASIVWHAPADGYEVRYLLVFQELDASEIGPVRSARNYIAHWTAELRGALAHYGGDQVSREWMTPNAGRLFTDVDGLGAGNPAYHRIGSREAPHNAYTSTPDLWRVATRLGSAPTFDPSLHVRPFRDDSLPGERGASQRIKVPYNTVRVGYSYDPTANAYLRSLDGSPQVDPLDGEQVTARTVVVLYMKFRTDSRIEPGYNRPVLGYIGTGKAQIFAEGKLVEGTWSKAGVSEPTLILGADGQELPLVRGRIFIQVVPVATEITVRS